MDQSLRGIIRNLISCTFQEIDRDMSDGTIPESWGVKELRNYVVDTFEQIRIKLSGREDEEYRKNFNVIHEKRLRELVKDNEKLGIIPKITYKELLKSYPKLKIKKDNTKRRTKNNG